MADSPLGTGIGSDIPTPTTRSTRRTRRLAIIGTLALVLVAGAVLVGVTTTGARGGYIAGNSCQNGGACALGNTGPGLGKVFYVAASAFKCGPTLVADCFYLEVAPDPAGSGGAGNMPWCNGDQVNLNFSTSTAIGTGLYNTRKMIPTCRSGAGYQAATYTGGGLTDWGLPSKDELKAMYTNRNYIGGYPCCRLYWSSTENIPDLAYGLSIYSGPQLNPYATDWVNVISSGASPRAVRAF